MKNSRKFKGTGVAMPTPFHKGGTINFKGFKKLIDHLIAGHVEYLVPLGTTGESVTLSQDEKIAVFDFVVESVAGRVPLVAGVGGNNTMEVLRCIEKYEFEGYDAILSVTPYYNKPSQKGLYQHYRMIANESPLPVILYNVPGRTGCNMVAETTLSLAEDFENIIGVKEASGNFEQIMDIIKNRPAGFLVISGDDAITLPLMACGADGVISVVANAFPNEFSEMVRLSAKDQFEKARKLHYLLTEITPLMFAEGNPAGVKAVLSMMDICEDHLRLPLVNVSKGLFNKLQQATEKIHAVA